VARYHLENAWPSKLEIGSLKAGDTSVVAERLTLTHDDVRAKRPRWLEQCARVGLGHLHAQLARGYEDERRGAPVGRVEVLDDRHRERERLARSRRRLGEDVRACERRGNDTRLYLEGGFDALRGERTDDIGAQAELSKGLVWHRVFDSLSFWFEITPALEPVLQSRRSEIPRGDGLPSLWITVAAVPAVPHAPNGPTPAETRFMATI
jgi:hypothetical protein